MTAPSMVFAPEVALLDDLALVAVEHEDELDLVEFANLLDLYSHFLSLNAEMSNVDDFACFVRDHAALAAAADRASHVSPEYRSTAPRR